MSRNRFMLVLGLLVVASMILSACGGGDTGTVATPEVIIETVEVEVEVPTAFATVPFALGDFRVRQALAYCTDKLELVQSVYPLASAEQQQSLVLNTMMSSSHWAYAGDENITIYEHNPEAGMALLEEAGWTMPEGADYRVNADDWNSLSNSPRPLLPSARLGLPFGNPRWQSAAFSIIRLHAPASWWFGDTTGIARRDYELGAFAWVGQADPGGQTLYACDQIPGPENNWEGQNAMGWCNEIASINIKLANNTLVLQERIAAYTHGPAGVHQGCPQHPALQPHRNFSHVAALTGFEPVSGQEYYLYDVGSGKFLIKTPSFSAFTQEPASLFGLVEDAFVAQLALYMVLPGSITTKNYQFQAVYIKDFPTLENGGTFLNEVAPVVGDKVVDAAGEVAVLAEGTMVKNFAGEDVAFTAGVTMPQLVTTFEYIDGITWEDGTPLSSADFALGKKITCDPESGATSFITCDKTADTVFLEDKVGYTQTWIPGVLDPLYFVPVWATYPAHRPVADGRLLADVPAAEWTTLPEIAEMPWGWGPYKLVEWVKGEKIVYVANPFWVFGAPKTPNFVIQMVTAEASEALLLGGEVDMLDSTTLAGLTQTLVDAETAGQVKNWVIAGGTWEHIDIILDK